MSPSSNARAAKPIQAYTDQMSLYMRVLEAAAPVEEPQPTLWEQVNGKQFGMHFQLLSHEALRPSGVTA